MLRYILFFSLITAVISCKTETGQEDYFGQTPPKDIPVVFAPGEISVTGRFEHGISFTPDGREMVFGVLNKVDFSGAIYYSKKTNNTWAEPEIFAPLKEESVYLPYFSPDGKSLIYIQSRTDTANYLTDIWTLNKNEGAWINPQKMGSPLSSLSRESTACMNLDRKIYFSSNRDGNGLADLYFSSPENGDYLKVEKLNEINSVRDEESIFASPNDDYILFSRYATNQNCPDLFISYRDYEGNLLEPVLLDSSINTADWERRPFVSINNKYLFFTRLTFGETGMVESDIYWVSTSKVFKPFVYRPLNDTTAAKSVDFTYHLPKNTFNHITDSKLDHSLVTASADSISWLSFDEKKMILSGLPKHTGEFTIAIRATDKNGNFTDSSLRLLVE